MEIQTIVPRTFASNCYIVSSGGFALIVDPSVSPETILGALEGNTPIGILLTHGHFDHIASIDKLRTLLNIPVYIHRGDAPMLTDARKNGFYTFFRREAVYSEADVLMDDGAEIMLGSERIRVLSTPGHSPGSVCYDCGDFIITGDTLFADSVGRSDLWGGDAHVLADSLQKMEKSFPPSARIYPGHGEDEQLSHALDNVFYF